jgi:hypothetical protein
LYQTGHSAGMEDTQKRFQVESDLTGIKTEVAYNVSGNFLENEYINPIRPKYAFFGDKNASGRLIPAYSDYGDVIAVLKNEVKKRSTWTQGDSLNLKYYFKKNINEFVHTFYDNTANNLVRFGNYYETQIWGPVTLNDVDHLLVGCFGNKPDHNFYAALKQFSIPIKVLSCRKMIHYEAAAYLEDGEEVSY